MQNYNCILAQPHELSLKSKKTRKAFEKTLYRNIKAAIPDAEIRHLEGSYLITCKSPEKKAKDLKYVFGLSKISPAVFSDSSEKGINNSVDFLATELELSSKKTFGVRAKVLSSEKKARNVEIELGDYIRKKYNSKVNLSDPDFWIFASIFSEKSIIYSEKINGYGGLPVGVSGRVLAVLDSSKESLLSAWLIAKRGCEIDFLLKEKNKSIALLKKYLLGYNIREFNSKQEVSKNYDAIVISEEDISKIKKQKILTFAPLIGLEKKAIKKAISDLFFVGE